MLNVVGADQYCTVGFGKIGRHDVISKESEVTWERYCGSRSSNGYCYRAETEQYSDMQRLYPEQDWEDGKDYYKRYYILGCGGDFHHQKKGCKNKEDTIWVKNESAASGKTYIEGFTTSYCCDEDYCSGAQPSRSGLGIHSILVSSMLSIGCIWLFQSMN